MIGRPYISGARQVAILLGMLVLAGIVGAGAGAGDLGTGSVKLFAVLLALVVFWAVVVARKTVPALVLLLAAGSINGIPGIQLHAGKQVYFTVVLAAVLCWLGRRNLPYVPKWIMAACACLLVWWGIGVMRALAIGAPPLKTLEFGCAFALYPLLLPAYVAVFRDRRLRRDLIFGAAGLGCWIAITNSAAALGLISPAGSLAHSYNSMRLDGLTRLYATSGELPLAIVPFALGVTIAGGNTRRRAAGFGVLCVCLVAIVLGLTRAEYFGIGITTLVMLAPWSVRFSRQVAALVVAVAATTFLAASIGPLKAPVRVALSRAESIFNASASSQATPSGDTLAYRQNEERAIRASMTTGDWVVGHGFLPSPWYTFTPDDAGSLIDTDLGWYIALNTMGLIGVGLVIIPVLLCAQICWRARTLNPSLTWLLYGGIGYALYCLVVSETLVTMFTAYGLSVVALALGAATATAYWEREL